MFAPTSNVKYHDPQITPYYKAVEDMYVPFELVISKKHGADPANWGPCAWRQIHRIAKYYPEKPCVYEQEMMKQWLAGVKECIPCGVCKKHYSTEINKHRDNMSEIVKDRYNLFAFTVYLHNKVNKRNGKPMMDVEEAWAMY